MKTKLAVACGMLGVLVAIAQPAYAISVVPPTPPTPLGTTALTDNGPEVFQTFNSGDVYEFTFTVPAYSTEYLDIALSATGDDFFVQSYGGLTIYSSTTVGPPGGNIMYVGEGANGQASYDVYVTLQGTDPMGGFELTDNLITLQPISTTPLPAALPLFAGGLGLLGFLSRRKRRAAAA